VVQKCREYGRDLLDNMYDVNKSKTEDYEENEAVLGNHLGDDDDCVFLRKVIA
jgi:hypothetical protein